MLKLIDADALMKAIKNFRWWGPPNTLKLMFDYLRIIINEQPTVDAVEVVRCHECQRSYKSKSSSTGWKCKCWGVYDTDCECDPNGFCHKGERRANNG